MSNGWTGGQYSLYRAIFGGYLCLWLVPSGRAFSSRAEAVPPDSLSPLVRLFPNVLAVVDAPWAITALLVIATGLAVLLAIGRFDRLAAFGLLYVGACFVRNPLIVTPGALILAWLLIAHLFIPRAPYGSWAARGRQDPGGGWSMPAALFGATWAALALAYAYSGISMLLSSAWLDGSARMLVLDTPAARPGIVRDLLLALPDSLLRAATWGSLVVELLFAPLVLARRLRPVLWLVLLLMQLLLNAVIDLTALDFAIVILHLFAFDPAWIRPLRAAPGDVVYYDGTCGLCHRVVRFLLAEDRASSLRFAPLDSESFHARVPEQRRAQLPDSIVVGTGDGRLLTRSTAVLYGMKMLGGVWRLLAMVCSAIPSVFRDRVYDLVAGVRHRLFARAEEACPTLPAHLRNRFDP